jgi:hypothetical protein
MTPTETSQLAIIALVFISSFFLAYLIVIIFTPKKVDPATGKRTRAINGLSIFIVMVILIIVFFAIFPKLFSMNPALATQSNNASQGETAFPTSNNPSNAFQLKTPIPNYRAITWRELNLFLDSDHTNWNLYIPDKYICVNFALDLVANAKKQNINAWIVGVNLDDSPEGHTFVAFNTSDKGVVWIEPQFDYNYVPVEVGKPLCYETDTSICGGKVTQIIQPLHCDAVSHYCQKEETSANSSVLVNPAPQNNNPTQNQGDCTPWREVTELDAGKYLCVTGTITRIDNWSNGQDDYIFSIQFSDLPNSFQFLCINCVYPTLKVGCFLKGYGTVSLEGKMPTIKLKDKDLFSHCN